MNLLLERRQRRTLIARRTIFKLWGQFELERGEEVLIDYYQMDRARLIVVPQPFHLRKSLLAGGIIALPVYLLFAWAFEHPFRFFLAGFPMQFDSGMAYWAAGLTAIVAAFVYYHQFRRTIYVADMIKGRSFKCTSIERLVREEAFLTHMSEYFMQVLETAKGWDNTEKIAIQPLPPDEARHVVIRGLAQIHE